MKKSNDVNNNGAELIFGLVCPIGCDIRNLTDILEKKLKSVGYTNSFIKISDLFNDTVVWTDKKTNGRDEEIKHKQDIGNKLRHTTNRNDAGTLLAINKIRELRQLGCGQERYIKRRAYIVSQIKTPEEVQTFRNVYGQNFFLLGLNATENIRREKLTQIIADSRKDSHKSDTYIGIASDLINRDYDEDDIYGQNVQKAYPLSDVFFLDDNDLEVQVLRFIRSLFGDPYITPHVSECVMYQASAAALRSSDPSRQVGAAITTYDGSVIALGTNEAPKVGGGLGWAGESPPTLTCDLEDDKKYKEEAIHEILMKIKDGIGDKIQLSTDEFISNTMPLMEKTHFMGIGEFGRPVHAEMSALIDAARRGVSVQGNILFTTTFPCQNCAKHIIAAGISAVIFINPYPKSYTNDIYKSQFVQGESPNSPIGFFNLIQKFNNADSTNKKILLGSYFGIAPRRYTDFFTMKKRQDDERKRINWDKQRLTSLPKLAMKNAHFAYMYNEKESLDVFEIEKIIKKVNK